MSHAPRIYEFGTYRLEVAESRLLRHGAEVKLRPKVFDLLVCLVQKPGQMLGKDELIESVWPETAIDDNNLTVSINELRRILGEGLIENVPKRGYRFVAAVKVLPAHLSAVVTPSTTAALEPPNGALPLHSPYYIERRADQEFHEAMARHDSIVLVKGARQVGKTSLLARGLQQARDAGAAVVLTDFQQLAAEAFATVDHLFLTLAQLIADKLELATDPRENWDSFLNPNSKFERFLRRAVLGKIASPVVWALDEVDRLFSYDYASEVFGLFRSWHNLRALEPDGLWSRFTLALAYATEAHLFITDLNQSPFNVGTRLTLQDFTRPQVEELNARYQSPLRDEAEVTRYYALLRGHPYLAHRGLYEMVKHGLTLDAIEMQAGHDEGIFGDHLRRMLVSLERDETLCEALRTVLRGTAQLTPTAFYRLRSAGLLTGNSTEDARLRCELYTQYLRERLL
jgi:DNA-binding winged helix-turn-helix (wHTH) protein